MDTIFIRDLKIHAILGVYDIERVQTQDILVSVRLSTDTHKAGQSDSIQDCIDYDQLSQKIRTLVINARRFTVEALAADIASLCLTEPAVQSAWVRVDKPQALPEASSVGVEIERTKTAAE